MQVLYLGKAPHTKETLPDFLKWRRVARHPLVFRRLTGSQRTPGFWGVTLVISYTFCGLEVPVGTTEINSSTFSSLLLFFVKSLIIYLFDYLDQS